MITIKLSDPQGNVASFISWRRLVKHLRLSGEIHANERITMLEIDEHGIQYYISTEQPE